MQSLERQLRRSPDDGPAWLVYADWLQERGDSRGTLIGLENRLEIGRLSPEERASVQALADRILADRQPEWAGSLPEGAVATWRHGFVIGLELPWTDAAIGAAAAWMERPDSRLLASLRLVRALPYEDDDGDGEPRNPEPPSFTALDTLDLSRLVALDVRYANLGPEGAVALAGREDLSQLSTFEAGYGALGDKGAVALAGASWFPGVSSLHLQENGIGPAGARAIAERAGPLTALDLRYDPIAEEGARAIAASPAVRSLQTLRLHREDVGDGGARALSESEHLPLPLRRYWKAQSWKSKR